MSFLTLKLPTIICKLNNKMNNKKIIKILIKNEEKLYNLNFKRNLYENFYEFNKNTKLGKLYKETILKIKICYRILKFKTSHL